MRAPRLVAKFLDTWNWELLFILGHDGRLSHAGIAEAVEDVHIASVLGHILKHWVGQSGKNLMDLAKQERHEAVITVAKNREQVHELAQVLTGADREWVPGSWLERQDVGKGASDVKQLR